MSARISEPVRCACIVGTRPEVIKMAPVIRRLRETDWASVILIATGQQDALLELALRDFSLKPDISIPHEMPNGHVAPLLSSVVAKLDTLFAETQPHCVISQGDTTSVLAASIAAFYRRIPFVHLEAGLRTNDLAAPFPEEFHRRAIAVGTALHCAPTATAAAQLRRENIPESRIIVSGNTVIDALLEIVAENPPAPVGFPSVPRAILLTAHRRENFGDRLRNALTAIRAFIDVTPDTALFFPVHPNPAVCNVAYEILSNHPRIVLTEPLSYREIVGAMRRAWLVVTDSGGLQEEAPALGKPVFVLRDKTERPEAIESGVVQLIGTARDKVFGTLMNLYEDKSAYALMARPVFPYGDGHAARKIVASLREYMGVTEPRAADPKRSPASLIGAGS